MEWLKELLKNAGVENVDELENKISKELPKYFKPASVFNEVNEKLKNANAEIETLKATQTSIQTEYENYKKGSISQADYEVKKKEIETNSKAEIEKVRLESKIDLAINNAKAKNVKSVKANLELDKIKLDGDKLLGFDDQIEALKKSDAYLFEIDNKVNKGLEDNNPNKRKNEGGNYEDDELDNLSDEEYFALQEKNNK
ncbi:MAG: hypothetical protein HFJ27_01210 [Clostridia bacterium]|nr:hypothetical protein [Clostridia bacterium]MCI9063887.1 hypothetical protein [Clostridia bacterium]